jgi:hypothetical protein
MTGKPVSAVDIGLSRGDIAQRPERGVLDE